MCGKSKAAETMIPHSAEDEANDIVGFFQSKLE
jgi:hypothetical protein